MGRQLRKTGSIMIAFALVLGMTAPVAGAARKVSLSAKKITVEVGSKDTLKVKNTGKKKVKWTIKNGKKYISLSKKKKTSVVVTGKKVGKAVVQAKVGNKKLTCKVTVKKAKVKENTVQPSVTSAPPVSATQSPASTATSTPGTETTSPATETPASSPSPSPTAPVILEEGEFRYDGLDTSWIDPSKPMIAFTFDDGPGGGYGSDDQETGMRIQQALKDAGAHATFFYIGSKIASGDTTKAEVKQAVDWGFEIANHSYDYDGLNNASAETIQEKLSKTDKLLSDISGYSSFLFRAPNVAYSDTMFEVIKAPLIDVSNWSNDWQSSVTTEQIINNVKRAKDGDIVNFHSTQVTTAEAVPTLLAYFKEQGVQIVSVSELFAVRGQKLMEGVKYSSCPPSK